MPSRIKIISRCRSLAGGVGSYYGRSLRLNFLGNVLFILGFKINVTGDLLEASLTGLDLPAMEKTLDQVGRLLASSRLLDMAIANESDVNRLVEAFFKGDYDFLGAAEGSRLRISIPTWATGTMSKRTRITCSSKTGPNTAAACHPAWPMSWAR